MPSVSVLMSSGISAEFRDIKHSAQTAADFFKRFGDHLKPWSIAHVEKRPVLIIDEANAFKEADDKPVDTRALWIDNVFCFKTINAFLQFVVRVTKEE
ncbi:hypothetical protein MJO28_004381 [Puccinia striiformis f. sp. tritici]|uniref:Uncharacterized protein n=1 Tax=Puccinia striiformis f. sp. tritici TaxID=168172 RepID=A0ACC0EPM6_9BASI|nr:hypothetical protein MJO28_004381 [Puccinia striiformis f. sp. tritici]